MRIRFGGMLMAILAAVFCWSAIGHAPLEVRAEVQPSEVMMASPLSAQHEHHPGGALQDEGTSWSVFAYVLKVIYYASFTLFIGWLLWSGWLRKRGVQAVQAQDIGTFLQRFHFLALLGYVFVYLYDLQLVTGEDMAAALFEYVQGWAYIAMVLLALSGFAVLFKHRMRDLIWSILMAAACSFGGHSTSYELQWLTLPSYIIHWLAASVWIGGMLLAIYMVRKHRELIWEWLPLFSRAALWSVAALFVTGTLNAVVYLPSVEYVYGTPWGRWLLIKVGAVALVLIASLFVRRAWKQRGAGLGKLLGLELSALAAVLLIVGLLTSQHPTPHEDPLDWHVMGKDVHMTLQITPNQPGLNTFVVKVWLPEEQVGPQSVEVTVQRGEDPPKPVGLTPVENEFTLSFPGFTEHRYRGQGRHLDRPGTWSVFVKVTDELGKVTEYEREIDVW